MIVLNTTLSPLTKLALDNELIESADLAGADVLTSIVNESDATIRLAAALALSAPRRGSVFANLKTDIEDLCTNDKSKGPHTQIELKATEEMDSLLLALQNSQLVQLPSGSIRKPLVLDGEHLYLQKMWHYEQQLSSDIIRMLSNRDSQAYTDLDPFVDVLFKPLDSGSAQQQKAAMQFLQSPFTVLTGGPGTGKTWTLRNALTLSFVARLKNKSGLNNGFPNAILTAPTGKAAARMKASIQNGLEEHLNKLTDLLSEKERNQLGLWLTELPTLTLHRLLGWNWENPTRFKHNRGNPLNIDLLLIDEASMIDLSMMSKLFEAIPNDTHMALVGDPNQLASVDAGTVLADICVQADNENSPLKGHIVELHESRRFNKEKGIGLFGLNCLRKSDHSTALESLSDPNVKETQLISDSDTHPSRKVKQLIVEELDPFFTAICTMKPVNSTEDAREILKKMGDFQVLCSQRHGNFGVYALNELAEQALCKMFPHIKPGESYAGLRILITRNDPSTGLFNGDMGILLKTEHGLQAFFPGLPQSYAVSRLPQWERATAMTIHKSQGSEFNHTMMVLPSKKTQIISRELIYTGATRASERLTIVSSLETISEGLKNKIDRHSGLADKLSG